MWIQKFKLSLLSATLVLAAGLSAPARATLTIADSPLFVAVSVDPNVMFIIDDSGSMHWEIMPDDILWTYYLFPRPNSLYGGGDYDARILWFDDGFNLNRRARSAQGDNNSVFYNPEITYRPWVREDGSSFPQANPTAALHNPTLPDRGSVNLTIAQSFNRWRTASGNDTVTRSFWPITFYYFNGGDVDVAANYVRYQIRGDRAFRRVPPTGTETEIFSFSWPNGVTRTVLEERQNFANWYTYYRSRILASRAGIGFAFIDQPSGMRVGYGSINQGSNIVDGVGTTTIRRGVRSFEGAARQEFYQLLYNSVIPNAGTPLRRSLDDAGRYFSRTDARGPWSSTPGELGGDELACRQNFTILMTDGYWNGAQATTAAARANVDGTDGPTITGPEGQSFTYAAVSPFADDRSDTLADVAMYYWKRDLRTDLPNLVPTTDLNPAFWQHMVTFGVGLGVFGDVDPDEAFAAIGTGATLTWEGDPHTSNPAKIDDLLHASVNSRGGFFSAADPDTFARELSRVLSDIVSRTAATTGFSLSSTRLTTDSLVFAAEFDSSDWSGDLNALDPETGEEVWEASQRLAHLITSEGLAARRVFSWNRNAGEGVRFDPSVSNDIKTRIVAPLGVPLPPDPIGMALADRIIDYLRGDQSHEQANGGEFRNREKLIGDIVNSEPFFAGSGNEGWARLPAPQGGGVTGAGSYGQYLELVKRDPRCSDPPCAGQRYDTVYVGANDGMLHAFDARNGRPLFSYVPAAVHHKLHHLTDPDYTHRFYVDGAITVADARVAGQWRSVLLGTLGAGGRGIFALDVTNPQSFDRENVLWELTHEDDPDIGFTFGKPQVTRLSNGTWVAIFGNGYNSQTPRAHLFVVRLDDGTILHKVPVGPVNNGLSGVAVWMDPDSRTFASRVYAGDLRGTMWRFDIASGSPTVTFPNGLFTNPEGRAITSTPTLAADPSGGVLVYYGTGKLIEPIDRLTTAPPLERFWAVRDRNSAIANNAGAMSNFGRVVLSNAPPPAPSGTRRAVAETTGPNGWYVNLRIPNTAAGNRGERVLSSPQVTFGRVTFATYEPSEEPCVAGGFQRFYVLNAVNGEGALGLPDCPDCGGVAIGTGAPVSPPVAIRPRPPVGPGGGSFDPDDAASPGTPPPATGSGRDSWCSQIGFINPATGQFQRLGTICDGRQVWRQIR
jgi:type IV pilus assembly protein PilY1